jgi:hypothetical protein
MPKDVIEWKKRLRPEKNDIAQHWIRESRCRHYRVVRRRCLLPGGFSEHWVAMYATDDNPPRWRILAEHRLERTARRTCEEHLRKQTKTKS